jgi:S-adenosylmethionine synthetase
VQQIARDVIKKIGYTKSEYMFEANSCGILRLFMSKQTLIKLTVLVQKSKEQVTKE